MTNNKFHKNLNRLGILGWTNSRYPQTTTIEGVFPTPDRVLVGFHLLTSIARCRINAFMSSTSRSAWWQEGVAYDQYSDTVHIYTHIKFMLNHMKKINLSYVAVVENIYIIISYILNESKYICIHIYNNYIYIPSSSQGSQLDPNLMPHGLLHDSLPRHWHGR